MPAPANRRVPGIAAVFLALTLLVSVVVCVATEQTGGARAEDLLPPGWERIGGFKGSARTKIIGRVNDLLFEQEASGSLYRDLGDVSLGLGYSPDRGEIKWENSFYRRVLPLHREIEPGGLVTADDLSSYLDIKTLISRGRLRIDAVTDIIQNAGVIGVQTEGGVSLTLGRIHPSLHVADRSLEDVLADADRGVVPLVQDWPEGQDKSLLRLATEGMAGLTQWIADGIGRRTVDTERGAIFYEGYGDNVTLFIDVGLPVEAEPFTEHDPRLGVGDFVRQITFVGLSPLVAGIGIYGIEMSYQHFYRFLRETTIVKEPGGTVLVQIKTGLAQGDESTPLKVRPEIRVLGVLTLGYTFFEQVFTGGKKSTYEALYRIDLNDPRGMSAFRALLGDAGRARINPLFEAAVDREGAERLATEVRRGKARSGLERFRFFGLFDYRKQRVSSQDVVETEQERLVETVLARTWRKSKRIGRGVNRSRKVLIRALGDIPDDRDGHQSTLPDDAAAVTLITGVRDESASGHDVRRAARLIRRVLDWDDHPVLDELAEVDPDLETRVAANLRLSLGEAHLDRIAAASEDELWTELADLLLGRSHRGAWSTTERRRAWKRSARAAAGPGAGPLVDDDAIALPGKPMAAKARYKTARRSVETFREIQSLLRDNACMSCLSGSFSRWNNAAMMQALMARIGTEPGDEVGYQYEVFIDEMLRPVTVENDVHLTLPIRSDLGQQTREAVVGRRVRGLDGESAADELTMERIAWQGDRFLEASQSRLEAGDVLLNIGAEATDDQPPPPCWMLRLYSDLQFAPDLTLRIDLREHAGVKADRTLGHTRFSLGEAHEVMETPFLASRYFYDIPLPIVDQLQAGGQYILLLRVLNPNGFTVSEEEQVHMVWPAGGLPSAAVGCSSPPLIAR